MLWMRRVAALAILASAPTMALGQDTDGAKPRDSEKVSNDDPGRPLQMPPASSEVKEALEDFERFRKRGAWERALKALYTIKDDQALRFVDGTDGFIISVNRKRRDVLSSLAPEGLSAYRLFYDDEARKLFEQARGADEQANLERIYSAYFTTTIGDDAADRLGDLYFEQGRFDRAADCWLSILRDRPDGDVPPALVASKAALALHRAGRRSEFEQIKSDIQDRHSNAKVVLGGKETAPIELVRSVDVAALTLPTAGTADSSPIDLTDAVEPVWQFRIGDTIEAGMTPLELNQWRASSLSSASPAAAIDAGILYVNFVGRFLALDVESGKIRWRTESFHNAKQLANQPAAQMMDSTRFAILARGERIWVVTRDLKDQNYMAGFQLECRRAEDGEVVWKSSDLPEYVGCEPSGPPLLADGKLFVPFKVMQNQPLPQQWVMAIEPQDGRLIWKTEIAVSRSAQQRYYYYARREQTPQVRLLLQAGALYVDTHSGLLVRLEADSGTLDWGFGYETEPAQSESHFIYSNMPQDPQAAGEAPAAHGNGLVFKGAKSSRIQAIDPNRMTVAWRRPIGKAVRVLGVDDRSIYLGGEELAAMDLATRGLTWAMRLPGGSYRGAVLIRPDGIWQATPRGIFELDPRNGEVRRIFRGNDLGAEAKDILVADSKLLTLSNRAITAYPLRPTDAPTPRNLQEKSTR